MPHSHSTEPTRPDKVHTYDEVLDAVSAAFKGSPIPLPTADLTYQTDPNADCAGILRIPQGRAADVYAWTHALDDIYVITLVPIGGVKVEVRAVGLIGGVPIAVSVIDDTVPKGLAAYKEIRVEDLEDLAVRPPVAETAVA